MGMGGERLKSTVDHGRGRAGRAPRAQVDVAGGSRERGVRSGRRPGRQWGGGEAGGPRGRFGDEMGSEAEGRVGEATLVDMVREGRHKAEGGDRVRGGGPGRGLGRTEWNNNRAGPGGMGVRGRDVRGKGGCVKTNGQRGLATGAPTGTTAAWEDGCLGAVQKCSESQLGTERRRAAAGGVS